MGLLSLGTPLPWTEAQKHADHVREHGINQFLHIWRTRTQAPSDEADRGMALLWGDEVEYIVVDFIENNEQRQVKLTLRASEILNSLEHDQPQPLDTVSKKVTNESGECESCGATANEYEATWHPEYGRYMIEGTPAKPYGPRLVDLLMVEQNMMNRRRAVQKYLQPSERLVTMTSFPLLGCHQFCTPWPVTPFADASHSRFVPDAVINQHARFKTLTRNIRARRGSKVDILVPIYHDKNTPWPFVEPLSDRLPTENQGSFADGYWTTDQHPDLYYDHSKRVNHVYLDAMAFGMGCSCLQITFQASHVAEARRLYDQLAVLSPIMLALTASSPVHRGWLTDVDCRWNIIAGSVDDRTEEELGIKPLSKNKYKISKSRYDSIDSYLCNEAPFKLEYNDIPLVKDEAIYQRLCSEGIDSLMAQHIAHLFIRDPLVVFTELLQQDDSQSTDHFENIQSTNWQTMRFKPPPSNSNIGWRVEFRSMEVQCTDYENAAFAIFIVLVTRVVLSFNLNFYLPLSRVDENMQTAQKRDAINRGLFYFRTHVYAEDNDEYKKMSINDIVNGNKEFPGLLPLVEAYLDTQTTSIATRQALNRYLNLVRGRACGQLMTGAAWQRSFIESHPEYLLDSRVNEKVATDLVDVWEQISRGIRAAPELHGAEQPLKL